MHQVCISLFTVHIVVGKNDGSYQGISYFRTKENHGLFIKASKATLYTPPQPIEPTKLKAATPKKDILLFTIFFAFPLLFYILLQQKRRHQDLRTFPSL